MERFLVGSGSVTALLHVMLTLSVFQEKNNNFWKTTFRSNDFKEDDAIWKNGEDGGTGGGGPPPTGMGNMGPTGGYVAK